MARKQIAMERNECAQRITHTKKNHLQRITRKMQYAHYIRCFIFQKKKKEKSVNLTATWQPNYSWWQDSGYRVTPERAHLSKIILIINTFMNFFFVHSLWPKGIGHTSITQK